MATSMCPTDGVNATRLRSAHFPFLRTHSNHCTLRRIATQLMHFVSKKVVGEVAASCIARVRHVLYALQKESDRLNRSFQRPHAHQVWKLTLAAQFQYGRTTGAFAEHTRS